MSRESRDLSEHAARLLEIIRILRDRPQTSDELAKRFGVSYRVIDRDLLALQGEPLYIPIIESDRREHAWTILRGWRF